MPRIRLRKDWKHRATRALSSFKERASEPYAFGAAIHTVAASIVGRPNRTTCCNAPSSGGR
jgi:hypothetical protein